MTSATPSRTRAIALGALLSLGAVALSGCMAPSGPVDPTGGPTATSTPSGTLPPTEQPDLGAPGPDCDEILSTEDVYAINPNLGAVAAPSPAEGSAEATIVSLDGTTCRWTNATSGTTLDAAVAVPSEEDFQRIASETESTATATTEYGDPPAVRAFFDVDGDIGTVQVFTSDHWVVLRSAMFVEAADAADVLDAVLTNVIAPGE